MTQELLTTHKTDILNLHSELQGMLRLSLDKAIKIGELLTEVKTNLAHGEFTGWITENMPFTDRTARNYMNLFKNRDDLKTETISVSDAYKQLMPVAEVAVSPGGNLNEFMASLDSKLGELIEQHKISFEIKGSTLVFSDTITHHEWLYVSKFLTRLANNIHFWLGDWALYQDKNKDRYTFTRTRCTGDGDNIPPTPPGLTDEESFVFHQMLKIPEADFEQFINEKKMVGR